MCRWLSYGTQHDATAATNLLHRREFSFTIAQDVYIRYLSYENADALRKGLCDQLPHKIDIGAVFTADPRDHKKFKLFEPVQREFLIDIDLTDYEFLDCDVKKIETCDRCWPIMALAARALNQILVKDFGFEHLLFVYSGRRGIHCWVCDTRARVMSNEVRSSVADYLGPKLNAATGRLSIQIPMHPTLKEAYETEWDMITNGNDMLEEELSALDEGEDAHTPAEIALTEREAHAKAENDLGRQKTQPKLAKRRRKSPTSSAAGDASERSDCTVVDVPLSSVGFITGYKGESLRAIERDSGG